MRTSKKPARKGPTTRTTRRRVRNFDHFTGMDALEDWMIGAGDVNSS